jgi:hypothetical protein
MTRAADAYAIIARANATLAADVNATAADREEAHARSIGAAALAYEHACRAVPLPEPSPWAALGLRVLARRMARRGACLPPGTVRVSL